jgi:hypothetical protein
MCAKGRQSWGADVGPVAAPLPTHRTPPLPDLKRCSRVGGTRVHPAQLASHQVTDLSCPDRRGGGRG